VWPPLTCLGASRASDQVTNSPWLVDTLYFVCSACSARDISTAPRQSRSCCRRSPCVHCCAAASTRISGEKPARTAAECLCVTLACAADSGATRADGLQSRSSAATPCGCYGGCCCYCCSRRGAGCFRRKSSDRAGISR
jgi:hypothetical protein